MISKIYLAILMNFLLASCSSNTLKNSTSSSQNFITGSVIYKEQTLLPKGSQISVKVLDVSRADVSSVTLGVYKTSEISRFPIPFKIDYLPSKIKRGFMYSVSARIEKNGKLLFINDTSIPVFQNGNIDKRHIKLPVIKIGGY
jgi:putative lipoprotein